MITRLSDMQYIKDSIKAFAVCITLISVGVFLLIYLLPDSFIPVMPIFGICIGIFSANYTCKKWPDILYPI